MDLRNVRFVILTETDSRDPERWCGFDSDEAASSGLIRDRYQDRSLWRWYDANGDLEQRVLGFEQARTFIRGEIARLNQLATVIASRNGTTIEAIPRGDLYLHLRMAWRGIESALVCLFAELPPYSALPTSLREASEKHARTVAARMAQTAGRGV